jgi:hypothetical protein
MFVCMPLKLYEKLFPSFCSFTRFSSFSVDSSENILYHAIMQGVLDINSWIETYGNLFIDFNSFLGLTPSTY